MPPALLQITNDTLRYWRAFASSARRGAFAQPALDGTRRKVKARTSAGQGHGETILTPLLDRRQGTAARSDCANEESGTRAMNASRTALAAMMQR